MIKGSLNRLLILILLLTIWSCKKEIKETPQISKVISEQFTSNAGDTIDYNVYKPLKKSEQSIPILYLLHGHGGNHYDWIDVEEGNVQHILDSLIRAKKIPPVVAVSVNAKNSWYVDHDILMEQIYINEFIPLIESQFKDRIDTTKRIIAGNSMGGYGALNYSLKYPELFSKTILLAPAAYYPVPPAMSSSRKIDVYKKEGQFNDSIWQQASYKNITLNEDKSPYPKFYTSTGDDDPYDIFDVVVSLKSYFEENQLPYEITVINGKHSWDVWRHCFTQDLIRALN